MQCRARKNRYGEIRCERCNFTWDAKDNDAPVCLTNKEINAKKISRLRDLFSDAMPDVAV